MKTPRTLLAASLLVFCALSTAPAAPFYWDIDAATGIQDGNGQWNTSSTFWNPASDGTGTRFAWNNTTNANDTAVFGQGGGTGAVSGSSGLQVGRMEVLENYSFGSWNVTLNSGELFVAADKTATISDSISILTDDLLKMGEGNLILGNATRDIDSVQILNGRITTSNAGATFNGTTTLTLLDTSGSSNATLFWDQNADGTLVSNIVVASGSNGTATIINRSASGGSRTHDTSGNIELGRDLNLTREGSNIIVRTWSGEMTGSGNLNWTPATSDSLTLTGDNSGYSGEIAVAGFTGTGAPQATLTLDGTQGNSNFTMGLRTKIEGNGTLNFNIVGDDADLISLTLDGTSSAQIELTGLTLNPLLAGSQSQLEYVIVNTNDGNSIIGEFANVTGGYTVDYDGTLANPNGVVLIIPEPSSAMLLLGGAGALLLRLGRSRRSR